MGETFHWMGNWIRYFFVVLFNLEIQYQGNKFSKRKVKKQDIGKEFRSQQLASSFNLIWE